mmetsp:Transcript_44609/g.137660  ORF Transcript_44609/g.137660 Transcript_44609/m.137660 type:complete len:392 (-) Transcript_44609:143-1318(-)
MSPRQKAPRGIRGGSVTTVRNAEPERAAPLDALLHRAPAVQGRRVQLPVRLHVVEERRLSLARPYAQPAGAAGEIVRRPLPVRAWELGLAALFDVAEVKEDGDSAVVLLRAVHLGVEVVVVRVVLLRLVVLENLQLLVAARREPGELQDAVDDRPHLGALRGEPRLARRAHVVHAGARLRTEDRRDLRSEQLPARLLDERVAFFVRQEVLNHQHAGRIAHVLHRKVVVRLRINVLEEVFAVVDVRLGLRVGVHRHAAHVVIAEVVYSVDKRAHDRVPLRVALRPFLPRLQRRPRLTRDRELLLDDVDALRRQAVVVAADDLHAGLVLVQVVVLVPDVGLEGDSFIAEHDALRPRPRPVLPAAVLQADVPPPMLLVRRGAQQDGDGHEGDDG